MARKTKKRLKWKEETILTVLLRSFPRTYVLEYLLNVLPILTWLELFRIQKCCLFSWSNWTRIAFYQCDLTILICKEENHPSIRTGQLLILEQCLISLTKLFQLPISFMRVQSILSDMCFDRKGTQLWMESCISSCGNQLWIAFQSWAWRRNKPFFHGTLSFSFSLSL